MGCEEEKAGVRSARGSHSLAGKQLRHVVRPAPAASEAVGEDREREDVDGADRERESGRR